MINRKVFCKSGPRDVSLKTRMVATLETNINPVVSASIFMAAKHSVSAGLVAKKLLISVSKA